MKLSVCSKTFIGMVAFGLGMGLVFPIYARFFTVFRPGMGLYFVLGCVVAGISVGLIAFVITRVLVLSAVARIAESLGQIADHGGDLSKRIHLDSRDCVGALASNFNRFVEKLQAMVGRIAECAESVAQAQTALSATSRGLGDACKIMTQRSVSASKAGVSAGTTMAGVASRSEETRRAVEAVALAVEQLRASVLESGHVWNKSAGAAAEAKAKAVVTDRTMAELSSAIAEISKIVGVIKDISDKTNLLALNASIEAASAGDAGRGFAVVANEVKALAGQTANATNDIDRQIERVRTSARSVVAAIGDTASTVERITSASERLSAVLDEENSAMNDIAQSIAATGEGAGLMAREIECAVGNVRSASDDLRGVDTAIRDAADGAAKVDEKASELGVLTAKLSALVNQFRRPAAT